MAGLTGDLTGALVARLSSSADGVSVRAGAIQSAENNRSAPGIRAVMALNATVEISEKAGHALYPALLVYCDKLSNSLKEKFRQFSGKAHMVVKIRHSQDRLDGLETNTQLYVDAVCALLDDARGDWGGGAFYSGGYDVVYEQIARGGKNFLQRAKVGLDVEVSK